MGVIGSPVDCPLNTLARAVDTLSGETPTPHKMMEDTAVCVALLPCPPLSGVPPDGSIRRTGWPRVVTGPGLPQTRTCYRVGRQRVTLAGTFPTAPLRTARDSFDVKQLSSGAASTQFR